MRLACCALSLVALLALLASPQLAAAKPHAAVSTGSVSGWVSLCATSACIDFGCAAESGTFPFQSGKCLSNAKVANSSYVSLIVRADMSNQWAVHLFQWANCNGGGDNAPQSRANVTMSGQGDTCNEPGALGSPDVQAFVVLTDVQAPCGVGIYDNPNCQGTPIDQFGLQSQCLASLDAKGGSQSIVTDPNSPNYVWSHFSDQNCTRLSGTPVKGQQGVCTGNGVRIFCGWYPPHPKRARHQIVEAQAMALPQQAP